MVDDDDVMEPLAIGEGEEVLMAMEAIHEVQKVPEEEEVEVKANLLRQLRVPYACKVKIGMSFIDLEIKTKSLVSLPSNFALSFTSTKVALFKVIDTSLMNGPIMTLAIGCSARFDETVVQTQIMPNTIPPSRSSVTKIRKVFQDILIDIS